jgi:DNA (cytosine-5)-methyltransferase 1
MGGHLTRSGARSTELLLPGVARAHGEGKLLPTPAASDASGGGANPESRAAGGHSVQLIDAALTTAWGPYEAAIQRQERFSRPAPSPTEPNSKGNPRLAAEFAEWMMMLPAGHVTAPAIRLSRNDQLKAIGNGVCPPQAVAAYRQLLEMRAVAA